MMTLGDLDLFYGMVNFGNMLIHKMLLKFLKIFFCLKNGSQNCLNEYMKICEKKRPRLLFNL